MQVHHVAEGQEDPVSHTVKVNNSALRRPAPRLSPTSQSSDGQTETDSPRANATKELLREAPHPLAQQTYCATGWGARGTLFLSKSEG